MERSHDRDNGKHHQGRETPDTSDISNADVAHEHTDVNVRVIVMFGIGLSIAIAITYFLISGIYRFMEAQEARANNAEVPASRVTFTEKELEPPTPHLQRAPYSPIHPLDDWADFDKRETDALEGYAWVDQSAGTVRIPIKQAKKMLAEQGLSSRPQQAGQPQTDALMDTPSYTSSGRMMEKRDR